MIYIGDYMKKLLLLLLISLGLGFLFSKILFGQYRELPVNSTIKKVYFIQQGVYSSEASMQENTSKLAHYTYEKIGSKYYVYGCFTAQKENIDIIKNYFQSLNYSIYAKEINIDNEQFLNILEQYDYLMNNIENVATVKNICKQIVTKYEELVLSD